MAGHDRRPVAGKAAAQIRPQPAATAITFARDDAGTETPKPTASPASHATLTASAVRNAPTWRGQHHGGSRDDVARSDRPAEVPCGARGRSIGRHQAGDPSEGVRPRQRVRAVGGGERPEDPGDPCRSHVNSSRSSSHEVLSRVCRTSWRRISLVAGKSTANQQLLSKFCRVLPWDLMTSPACCGSAS